MLQQHGDNPDFLDKMVFAMQKNPTGQFNRPLEESAFELLVMCAGLVITSGYIVLDAMDECRDSDEMMAELRALSNRTGIKIILFSRPSLRALYEEHSSKVRVSITKECSDDIRLFLGQELEKLKSKRLLPRECDSAEVLKRLVRRADGMFLWAELMITYLRIPALTPRRRMSMVMSTADPEGLDAMYDRIANVILSQSTEEKNMAKRMIILLIHATQHLDENDYEMALNLGNGITSWDPDDRISQFRDVIVTTCGGLVEPVRLVDPARESFQFIHLTTKEYFLGESVGTAASTKKSDARIFLSAPLSTSNCELAQLCCTALIHAAPGESLHWKDPLTTDGRHPCNQMPFVLYASCCWINHIIYVNQQPHNLSGWHTPKGYWTLLETVEQFLRQPNAISRWLETSYSFGVTPDAQGLMTWAQTQADIFASATPKNKLTSSTLELVETFANDVMRLEGVWGNSLRETPSCIWDEVPGFMQSQFLITPSPTGTLKIISDAKAEDRPKGLSTACLCKISSSPPKGDVLAILGVWPSQ
jgi:hypothetical protein